GESATDDSRDSADDDTDDGEDGQERLAEVLDRLPKVLHLLAEVTVGKLVPAALDGVHGILEALAEPVDVRPLERIATEDVSEELLDVLSDVEQPLLVADPLEAVDEGVTDA